MISIADEEIDRIAFAFKIELVSFILKTRKVTSIVYCLLARENLKTMHYHSNNRIPAH